MDTYTTDKNHIAYFAALCAAYGMRKVVVSPGSRSAPITVAFHHHPDIECYVVPDERSAAYFALGIAQYSGEPVGIICTSGTAALNYAPAIAEAYHQKLPLVAITADRPPEWVGQLDGQTIDQSGIYRNFVAYEAQIPVSTSSAGDIWQIERVIRDGFMQAIGKRLPVHFNVPLREPLYNMEKYTPVVVKPVSFHMGGTQVLDIAEDVSSYKRILVIAGMQRPCSDWMPALHKIAESRKVVIFRENLSNIDIPNTFSASDALLFSVNDKEVEDLKPDLVISFGDMLLSKPLKVWIRNLKNAHHWIISDSSAVPDVFQKINRVFSTTPACFLDALTHCLSSLNSTFFDAWDRAYQQLANIQAAYVDDVPWSDFKVFQIISASVPGGSFVHLGNSSPVRYAQFFSWKKDIRFFANRGTAGIDGSTSTAIGMASQTSATVTMVTGDVSFLYDSNALWNNYKRENFKIILINNKGGNIFKLIPGPDNTGLIDEYFLTHVPVSVEHMCKAYGVGYLKAVNVEELEQSINLLYSNNQCSLLEVHTDLDTNTAAWKNFFKYVKTNMIYE